MLIGGGIGVNRTATVGDRYGVLGGQFRPEYVVGFDDECSCVIAVSVRCDGDTLLTTQNEVFCPNQVSAGDFRPPPTP